MKTTLYLLRHAATEANLADPPLLQGRRHNPPLAPYGQAQARLTRDFLAARPIDACYSSPMMRALQTAAIIARPHDLTPVPIEALTECDVGQWEGKSWQVIRQDDPASYDRFMSDPATHGYLGGENFAQVYARASAAVEEILAREAGKAILVVSHHIVTRTLLAGFLGMPIAQARGVSLDNCGISVVIRDGDKTNVTTLNAVFHLQGAAA